MKVTTPKWLRRLFWKPVFKYHMAAARVIRWRLRNAPCPIRERGTLKQKALAILVLDHYIVAGDALMLSARIGSAGGGK